MALLIVIVVESDVLRGYNCIVVIMVRYNTMVVQRSHRLDSCVEEEAIPETETKERLCLEDHSHRKFHDGLKRVREQ